MITIFLGNIGSGKTAVAVKTMLDRYYTKFYSNIKIKKENSNCIFIDPSMMLKKELIESKTKKDGTVQNTYNLDVNKEFWQNAPKPLSVVLDETDQFLNARMSMSKINRLINLWIAMLRRVLGSADTETELILITQLSRKIDSVPKEMAHKVKYFVCHYLKQCQKCLRIYQLNSEMPDQLETCPHCRFFRWKKFNHVIEQWSFAGMEDFTKWKYLGLDTSYEHFNITNIEEYFPYYDTYQWESMFEDLYKYCSS